LNPFSVRYRLLIVLTLAMAWAGSLLAQNLKARVDGDRLRITSGKLHFLTGRPLERLHNGAAVTYVLRLTLRGERAGRMLSRIAERFTFSYDLWEEKFSVTWMALPARSVSNLSASAAESWCLENLSLPISEAPDDRPFWLSVEYESEDPRDSGETEGSPLTLGSLIDIFSRRSRTDQEVKGSSEELGPLRLQDLMRKKPVK
jgi:hypothetical protein